MQAVHQLQSGVVAVNGYGAERCEMPCGGRNQSGYGRELSLQSLEVFLNTKAVHTPLCTASSSSQAALCVRKCATGLWPFRLS